VLRRQQQQKQFSRKNIQGSSRAEGYAPENRRLVASRAKSIAKAIDGESSKAQEEIESGSMLDDGDDEQENERRKARLLIIPQTIFVMN
jgi:hypothetical protein